MAVNYNDKRFQQVENEKATALREVNSTYDNMINSTDKMYQDQINASKDYEKTQSQLQQEQTDFAIEKLEQNKEWAEQDYLKEQKGAYVDYQQAMNPYGGNAEAMASRGLTGSGYAQNVQATTFGAYQNRVATARESFNRTVVEFSQQMQEAIQQNKSALAQIAYESLQKRLELTLQGFQYKNSLLEAQLQAKQQTDDRYYNRWQNVLQQINTENSLAEQQRQFNEQMALQRAEQESIARARASASGGSSGGSSKSKSGGGGYTVNGYRGEVQQGELSEAGTKLASVIDSVSKGKVGKTLRNNTAREMINSAYSSGDISEADVKRLASMYGLD